MMSISLKVVVKPTFGFQGALQGAGTPNQAGIGGFLPLSVGDNSVWFVDALVNANFTNREGDSSIINTDVAGTTVSPQRVLAIACSMLIAVGCSASMVIMTTGR